jgi:hypothetical protein
MIYNEKYNEALYEIYLECYEDAEFKARFLSDPASVLKEWEIEIPAGITIKAVEDSEPNVITLHLPPEPDEELSDEDLEAVAGGKRDGGDVSVTLTK